MVARAYGKAFTEEEMRDVYSAAWTATLSALRTRGAEMSDDELRSYILTAVASHASKEMRRRTRKPAGSLDDSQEGVIADSEQLLPEEQAIGNETGGIARDLLSTLPPRRRAVMLLRYGWGLRPEEVCALVSGLSSRAYRKEITRGVAELIERLELIETGEWCKSREPMLRDYIAGTASEQERLQVTEHLRHCRGCSSLAVKLRSHLHELGAVVALAAVSGAGSVPSSLPERLLASWHGLRDALTEKADQAAVLVGNLASSGGARGTGVAGAGVIAKVAGAGGTGKAALACLGVTAAAAGACVATGVVPSIPVKGVLPEVSRDGGADRNQPGTPRVGSGVPAVPLARTAPVSQLPPDPPAPPKSEEPTAPTGEGAPSNPPSAPVPVSPAQEEFDPVVAAPTSAPAPAPPSSSSPEVSGGSGGSGGSAQVAAEEFGP